VAFSRHSAHKGSGQNELLGRSLGELCREPREVKIQRRKKPALLERIQVSHGSRIPIEIHHSKFVILFTDEFFTQGFDQSPLRFVPVNAEFRTFTRVHPAQEHIEDPAKVPIVIIPLRSKLQVLI